MSAEYATRASAAGTPSLVIRARPSGVQLVEARVDGREVHHVGARLQRARVVVLDGGREQAEGGEHPRGLGHEHVGHAHLLGEGHAVHRPGAAEHHQREVAADRSRA